MSILKVGLSLNTNAGPYDLADSNPRSNRVFIDALRQQAREADRLGFDGVFVAERHSRSECRWPNPLSLLTVFAAETKRVELVTHVLLLPLHNPCDIAEQAALADIVSDGRLVLGLGMGFNESYFATFGVPIAQRRSRFDEGIDILKLAWTGEPFDYSGRRFQLTGAQVLPTPARAGGPPMGCGGPAPGSVDRAAAVGDGWVVAWPLGEDDWKQLTERYRSACAQRNKTPQIIASRHCFVGRNRAEVERTYVPMWLEEMRYYWRQGQLKHPDFASDGDFTVENARKHVVIGSPADCMESLQECASQGIDYVKLSIRLPLGPSMDEVNDCISRIGEEVLPALRGATPAIGATA